MATRRCNFWSCGIWRTFAPFIFLTELPCDPRPVDTCAQIGSQSMGQLGQVSPLSKPPLGDMPRCTHWCTVSCRRPRPPPPPPLLSCTGKKSLRSLIHEAHFLYCHHIQSQQLALVLSPEGPEVPPWRHRHPNANRSCGKKWNRGPAAQSCREKRGREDVNVARCLT